MDKIVYKCKNCGWESSIPEQWADLKPKKCPNRKCKTHFLITPDSLEIKKSYTVISGADLSLDEETLEEIKTTSRKRK